MKGIDSIVVDTTGRAIFRTAKDVKAPEDDMNAALKKAGDALKVRKLQKRTLEKAASVVLVRLDGFG